MKQGGRDRRVKQGGNRDEWRRVRDGSEIGWRGIGEGDWRCNGEGAEQNRVVRDPSAIQYLTTWHSEIFHWFFSLGAVSMEKSTKTKMQWYHLLSFNGFTSHSADLYSAFHAI